MEEQEEQEIRTREELEVMPRLRLRKLAKKKGMSAEDAAKAHSDVMIEHILETQEEGSSTKGKSAKGKGRSSKASTKGKTNGQTSRSRRAPGRSSKASSKSKPAAEPEETGGEEGVVTLRDVIERLDTIGEEQDNIRKRIDRLGKVVTENNEAHLDTVNELRADTHVIKELVIHLGKALGTAEAVDDNSWPDEMDMDDKAQALEEEVGEGGNEEGDGE